MLTAALSWAASRYHLSADQVTAIGADVGTVVAMAYGIYSHGQAAKMAPPNGGTHASA